jgi:hypothetical protein
MPGRDPAGLALLMIQEVRGDSRGGARGDAAARGGVRYALQSLVSALGAGVSRGFALVTGTTVVAHALTMNMTALSKSPSSQYPAIQVGSGGLA